MPITTTLNKYLSDIDSAIESTIATGGTIPDRLILLKNQLQALTYAETSTTDQTAILSAIRDRLTAVTTYTDDIENLITLLNSYTDGIESLLTAANTTSTSIANTLTPIQGFIDGIEDNQATQIARLETIRDRLPSGLANDRLKVDGSAVTQPVSGTVSISAFPATQAISALSLPLPTGAASATNQSSQITIQTAIRDRLPVNLGASTAANSLPVTLSTDGAFSTGFGTVADVAATSDTGSFSFLAFLKRLLSLKLPSALTANGNFKVAIAESVTRTPTYISTSATGTIAAGAQSIAIANIGSAAGTVMGVSLPAGASISWGANANDTLSAVSYVATSTTFLITTII